MSDPTLIENPEKIGIGGVPVYGRDTMLEHINALNLGWFYDWSATYEKLELGSGWYSGGHIGVVDAGNDKSVSIGGNNSDWLSYTTAISANQSFTFSFDGQADAGSNAGLVINFTDKSGTVISSNTYYIHDTDTTFTLTGTTPGGAAAANIVSWGVSGNGAVIDDVSLIVGGQEKIQNGDFEAASNVQFDSDDTPYISMIWGPNDVTDANLQSIVDSGAEVLLGFNEPDIGNQSNMTVQQAIDLWPQLMSTGLKLGSPAVTSTHAIGENSWLGQFMAQAEAQNLTVDFITVHYYTSNQNVAQFQKFLTNLYNAYQKPIWVTEWGLVNFGDPDRFTMDETTAYFKAGAQMMDDLPFVEKHAWFGLYDGLDGWNINTQLYDANGELTSVGLAFEELIGQAHTTPDPDPNPDPTPDPDPQPEPEPEPVPEYTHIGTDGADTIKGSSGDDVIQAGDGDDTVNAGSGHDVVYGGAGDDYIRAAEIAYGEDGNDSLYGSEADDALYGGAGDDLLIGYDGDDILVGGAGADTLKAGNGDDILIGDADDVLFQGGSGFDTLIFESGGAYELGKASLYGIDLFDMRNNQANDIKLDWRDIIQSDDDVLYILGDAEDSVTFDKTKATLVETVQIEGETFAHYDVTINSARHGDLFVSTDVKVFGDL